MSSLHSVAEFLASLIAWFDSKEKGTAVVLFLTALFIFLAAPSAWRHRFFVSRIREGTTAVNHATGEPSWSPADRLNAVTKTLEGNTVLGTAWNLYRATLRDTHGARVASSTSLSPAPGFRRNGFQVTATTNGQGHSQVSF
jgi:hypothetical protein